MISSSAAFQTAVAADSRTFRARFLYNGDEVVCDIRSLHIWKGSTGASGFVPGTVFCPYLEAVADGCDDALEGKELELKIGIRTGGTLSSPVFDEIRLGYFTVGKPKTTAHSTTFQAYGRISLMDGYIETIPSTLTLAQLASRIQTDTGITVAFESGIDTSVLIGDAFTTQALYPGLTYRDVLGILAAAVGGYATETADGSVKICAFGTTVTKTVSADTMIELPEFHDYDTAITGVKVIVDDGGGEGQGTSYTSGTPVNLETDNIYMTSGAFTQYAGNLVGLEYRGGNVSLSLGDPRLEPWDTLQVTDSDQNTYILPCMSLQHIYDGGFQTKIEAPSVEAGRDESMVARTYRIANAAKSKAQAAMTTANGKNKVVHQTSDPGTTGFSVGDTWFDTDDGYKMYRFNGSSWVAEQFDTPAIKDNAITADKILADSVTAGKIATGAITADKIAANSISVSKLSIGMENLATVNEWDDGSMVKTPSGYQTATMVINSTSGLKAIVKGDAANRPDATNTRLALSQYKIPNIFVTGDEIYYSLRARAVDTARTVYLRIAAYDSSGAYLGTNGVAIPLTTSFAKFTGTITLENGNDWAWSNNSGNLPIASSYFIYINDSNGANSQIRLMQVEIRRKGTGNLIVDGTITASKLSADAINGKTITGTTLRTPSDYGNEMMFINDPDPGSVYYTEPFYATNLTRYMQLVQSGLESVDQSNYVRARMAPTILKVYKNSETGTNLVRQLEGWFLKGMAFSPRMYTQEGEVATIAPNRPDSVIDQDVKYLTDWRDVNVTEWDTLGGCWFYKIGTRVHVHMAVSGLTANTNTIVAGLPAGYRPYDYVVAAGRANNGSTFASMWINSSGTITIRSASTSAAVDIEYDAFN